MRKDETKKEEYKSIYVMDGLKEIYVYKKVTDIKIKDNILTFNHCITSDEIERKEGQKTILARKKVKTLVTISLEALGSHKINIL